jgi:putative membrane protein
MIERLAWFRVALQIRGSVVPMILPRMVLFAGFGVLVSLLEYFHVSIASQVLGDLTANVVFNLVLGLLLVFRTNAAYDRFWEGRQALGLLVVNIRTLAREIQLAIPTPATTDQANKQEALRLLTAFAIATKLHLRQEVMDEELQQWLAPEKRTLLDSSKNPPLQMTFWIGEYLQRQFHRGLLDNCRVIELNRLLNCLVEGLTSCERIAKTSIPIAYSIYLKRLILIYCVFLPFHLVSEFHWWTGFVVAVISFILLGVEEVGSELDNPFGRDPNDLPVDEICHTIAESVESVLAFAPGDRTSREFVGTVVEG